jgi:PAS domain-containing protein
VHDSRVPAQPLELILARNLIANVSVPAFIASVDGDIVFYNDAAGALIGKRFEESGRLTPEEWRKIGPLDAAGAPVADGRGPLTTALRERRPAHERFHICTDERKIVAVETSAVPLTGATGFHGAMVVFWPVTEDDDEDGGA